MSFIAGVNRLVLLFVDTFRQLLRGRIWLILLAYYALQWLVLYAHYEFTSPLFHWLVSLSLVFQDANRATAFTHYPSHLVFLPAVYGTAKFVLGVIFEGLALGGVAALFHREFFARRPDAKPGPVLPLWLNLTIVWLALNGLTLALSYALPAALASQLYSPKRLAIFSFIIMPAAFTMCVALFYYAVPVAVATRRNVFYALGRALKLFVKNPITTLALSAIIIAGPVFLAALSSGYAATIVEKFRPELVYWLLTLGLFVEMVASFFWMGTATRFLADEPE
jgi:hypothetical protein